MPKSVPPHACVEEFSIVRGAEPVAPEAPPPFHAAWIALPGRAGGQGAGTLVSRELNSCLVLSTGETIFCSCRSFQGHGEGLEPGAGGAAGRRREIINRPNGPAFLETHAAYEQGDVQTRWRVSAHFDQEVFSRENFHLQEPLKQSVSLVPCR